MQGYSLLPLVLLAAILLGFLWNESLAFLPQPRIIVSSWSNKPMSRLVRFADSNNKDGNQQYRNVATEVLSKFMQEKDNTGMTSKKDDPLEAVDFNVSKQPVNNLETLAAVLDYELTEKEWFVTGNVNPAYFADSFEFQDPDVSLEGIEAYARGVNTLFDQESSRAEIIETVVNPEIGENVITCTWRLSGKANIGPGLTIKPYIVFSDLTVDNGLIVRQEDRFDLPQWDILLSSLFPFLIGKLCAEPAPPVEPRVVPKPVLGGGATTSSPLDILTGWFNSDSKE